MQPQIDLNNICAREGNSNLTVIILTFNEELHIKRCLHNAFQVASCVFVVDSFSTDKTVEIAQSHGAQTWQHEFKNHAKQLVWAMENLPIATEWVMRIDADEVISPALVNEIREKLSSVHVGTNGFLVYRLVCFSGKIIHYGAVSHWVLRMWRHGSAEIEQRWMDEHMVLKSGHAKRLKGEYLDDNLNNVTWWTNKHNGYATREAIDLLNHRYRFLPDAESNAYLTHQTLYTRWLKENLYVHLPMGLRAFLYFAYRMIFRLGILDGRRGFIFHFLQGFWYRFLVDVKVQEVERRMRAEGIECAEAIQREFRINPLL